MSLSRKARRDIRRTDARRARERNYAIKSAERRRRDARMREKLRAGSLPYTPPVMSWLSRKLDKPSSRITTEDIQGLME